MPRKAKSKAKKALGAATAETSCARHQTILNTDIELLSLALRRGTCPLNILVRTSTSYGVMHECIRSAGGRYDFEGNRAVTKLNNVIDDFNNKCMRKKR